MKVVNTITGEIMELKVGTLDQAIGALVDLKGLEDSVERAKKKIKEFADKEMLQDKYEHSGWMLERRTRDPKQYLPGPFRAAVGDDVFMDFAKVDKTAVDNWRRELVDRGEL